MKYFAVGGMIVFLVVGIILGRATDRGAAEPISYWLAGDQTLGIQVIGGHGDFCGIASVAESGTDVRIEARCVSPIGLGSTAEGVMYNFLVRLGAPLGGRAVLDASGGAAALCGGSSCMPAP